MILVFYYSVTVLCVYIDIEESTAQSVVNGLQILEVLSTTVHDGLKQQVGYNLVFRHSFYFDFVLKILSLFECLRKCLVSSFTAVRHMAARCIANYAKLDLHATMKVKLLTFTY